MNNFVCDRRMLPADNAPPDQATIAQ